MNVRTMGAALAALAGVASIGMAVWGAPFRMADAGATEVAVAPLAIVYFIGGLLAILSLPLTSRSTAIARALLAGGGVLLIVGTVVFAGLHSLVWSALIPAILMLGVAPFIGRRPPRPDDTAARQSSS